MYEKIFIVPIIVGALGSVPKDLSAQLKKLELHHHQFKSSKSQSCFQPHHCYIVT